MGPRRRDLDLDELFDDEAPADDLIDLDDAVTRLTGVDPDAAALVKLRVFAGLTLGQAAHALGIARRTADATGPSPAHGCSSSSEAATIGGEMNARIDRR